jgi:hypothetical protein
VKVGEIEITTPLTDLSKDVVEPGSILLVGDCLCTVSSTDRAHILLSEPYACPSSVATASYLLPAAAASATLVPPSDEGTDFLFLLQSFVNTSTIHHGEKSLYPSLRTVSVREGRPSVGLVFQSGDDGRQIVRSASGDLVLEGNGGEVSIRGGKGAVMSSGRARIVVAATEDVTVQAGMKNGEAANVTIMGGGEDLMHNLSGCVHIVTPDGALKSGDVTVSTGDAVASDGVAGDIKMFAGSGVRQGGSFELLAGGQLDHGGSSVASRGSLLELGGTVEGQAGVATLRSGHRSDNGSWIAVASHELFGSSPVVSFSAAGGASQLFLSDSTVRLKALEGKVLAEGRSVALRSPEGASLECNDTSVFANARSQISIYGAENIQLSTGSLEDTGVRTDLNGSLGTASILATNGLSLMAEEQVAQDNANSGSASLHLDSTGVFKGMSSGVLRLSSGEGNKQQSSSTLDLGDGNVWIQADKESLLSCGPARHDPLEGTIAGALQASVAHVYMEEEGASVLVHGDRSSALSSGAGDEAGQTASVHIRPNLISVSSLPQFIAANQSQDFSYFSLDHNTMHCRAQTVTMDASRGSLLSGDHELLSWNETGIVADGTHTGLHGSHGLDLSSTAGAIRLQAGERKEGLTTIRMSNKGELEQNAASAWRASSDQSLSIRGGNGTQLTLDDKDPGAILISQDVLQGATSILQLDRGVSRLGGSARVELSSPQGLMSLDAQGLIFNATSSSLSLADGVADLSARNITLAATRLQVNSSGELDISAGSLLIRDAANASWISVGGRAGGPPTLHLSGPSVRILTQSGNYIGDETWEQSELYMSQDGTRIRSKERMSLEVQEGGQIRLGPADTDVHVMSSSGDSSVKLEGGRATIHARESADIVDDDGNGLRVNADSTELRASSTSKHLASALELRLGLAELSGEGVSLVANPNPTSERGGELSLTASSSISLALHSAATRVSLNGTTFAVHTAESIDLHGSELRLASGMSNFLMHPTEMNFSSTSLHMRGLADIALGLEDKHGVGLHMEPRGIAVNVGRNGGFLLGRGGAGGVVSALLHICNAVSQDQDSTPLSALPMDAPLIVAESAEGPAIVSILASSSQASVLRLGSMDRPSAAALSVTTLEANNVNGVYHGLPLHDTVMSLGLSGGPTLMIGGSGVGGVGDMDAKSPPSAAWHVRAPAQVAQVGQPALLVESAQANIVELRGGGGVSSPSNVVILGARAQAAGDSPALREAWAIVHRIGTLSFGHAVGLEGAVEDGEQGGVLSLTPDGATVGFSGSSRIQSSSRLTVGGTVLAEEMLLYCDDVMARDIEPGDQDAALDIMIRLPVSRFNWRAEHSSTLGLSPDARQLGILAQSAESVAPDLVWRDHKHNLRGLSLNRLLYMTVLAVQALAGQMTNDLQPWRLESDERIRRLSLDAEVGKARLEEHLQSVVSEWIPWRVESQDLIQHIQADKERQENTLNVLSSRVSEELFPWTTEAGERMEGFRVLSDELSLKVNDELLPWKSRAEDLIKHLEANAEGDKAFLTGELLPWKAGTQDRIKQLETDVMSMIQVTEAMEGKIEPVEARLLQMEAALESLQKAHDDLFASYRLKTAEIDRMEKEIAASVQQQQEAGKILGSLESLLHPPLVASREDEVFYLEIVSELEGMMWSDALAQGKMIEEAEALLDTRRETTERIAKQRLQRRRGYLSALRQQDGRQH